MSTTTKTLLQQIQDGDRKVPMCLYSFRQKKEQRSCTLAEARGLARLPMAKGHHWSVDSDLLAYGSRTDGDHEYDQYGPEIEEVRKAISA